MPRPASGNTINPVPRRLRLMLAHDWLVGVRGGEHVLEAIAAALEGEHELAGVLTMFDDGGVIGHSTDKLQRTVWPGGKIPVVSDRLRRWMLPLYPRAVTYLSEQLHELHRTQPLHGVISTSSAAIKGLLPPPGVAHICYCHSPARYVWSQEEQYRKGSVLRGLGLRLYRERFKNWDRSTAAHVTHFVANSRHTARQIDTCFGRDALVIHPPVRTLYFTPDAQVQREDFWLYVGALESYKNVELAMAAAQLAGKRLVIAGDGSDAARLRGMNMSGIEFVGRVSNDALRGLYRRARLVVFPQCEDFGIVAVEAQACGTPVVALGRGGAVDSVIDGLTGSLFHEATPQAMAEAAQRCPEDEVACRGNAERFSEERFQLLMRNLVMQVM